MQLKLTGASKCNANDNDVSFSGGDNEDDDIFGGCIKWCKLSIISEEKNDISFDDDHTIHPAVDRDVVTFFSQYISKEGKPPMQPMSILQERYNVTHALQHKIDKQAQIKSIKGWFNDTKHE